MSMGSLWVCLCVSMGSLCVSMGMSMCAVQYVYVCRGNAFAHVRTASGYLYNSLPSLRGTPNSTPNSVPSLSGSASLRSTRSDFPAAAGLV